MDSDETTEALENIQRILDERRGVRSAPPSPPGVGQRVEATQGRIEQATSLIDKIKDNIAYILGLPATLGGAFGFLWDSGNEQAELAFQVEQLEEAVADLQSQNDLLGGGTKNFSIDMSGAPGGSMTVIIAGAIIVVGVALLFWYQSHRRR